MPRTLIPPGLLLCCLLLACCASGQPAAQADSPPPPGGGVAATVAATSVPTPAPPTATPDDGMIGLSIREHMLRVELASTPEQRSQGLMFRENLPPDQGMLFVFADDRVRSFWMRNTPIPLSIAFLDADRRIINILDMEPFDETLHQSAAPARYALEVNQGWFAARGMQAGDLCAFELPDDLVIR